jgi:hypothetical protein
LDTQINAAASVKPKAPSKGFQIGPVQIALAADVGTTYDDNINNTQLDRQSDFVSQIGSDIGLDWPVTDHSELNLGGRVSYLHYNRFTGNNGLEISPDSALTYAISLEEVTLTLYDQLTYSRQVTTEASLANQATLPRLDNVAGLRGQWDPDAWTFQLGYSHDEFITDASENYLNRSSEYFFSRAGRVVAEQTQFGVEASATLTHYEIASQADNDDISVGLYANWQILPALQVVLRGGPTFDQYYYPASRGGGTSQLNSYYLHAEVHHQLTDYLSENLQVERDIQAGSTQGSDYIEQLTASYSVGYNHWQRNSNIADRGYTENAFSLSFNYAF